ncbi:DNA repair and recombination protein RadA [Infirmifilum sp. SLHALR2]
MSLEDLKGVGRVTLKKLEEAGIRTLRQLAVMNPEELEEMASIEPARAYELIVEARRMLGLMGSGEVTAEEYEKMLAQVPRLKTQVQSIDELLGGGLESGAIYEFAGEFGTGKTQLCHQLAVTAQLPRERGGFAGKALYIDTEGTFSPQRIREVAARFGLDGTEALRSVYVERVESVVAMEHAVRSKAPRLIEERGVRLIVVDSVIALYRAQFRGREWLAMRQQRLNYVLDWLKRLGRVYQPLFTVITNQVMSSPMPGLMAIKIPAGGNIVAHASTHRFILRKAGQGKHVIQVLDSPYLPKSAEAEFCIASGGVVDGSECPEA